MVAAATAAIVVGSTQQAHAADKNVPPLLDGLVKSATSSVTQTVNGTVGNVTGQAEKAAKKVDKPVGKRAKAVRQNEKNAARVTKNVDSTPSKASTLVGKRSVAGSVNRIAESVTEPVGQIVKRVVGAATPVAARTTKVATPESVKTVERVTSTGKQSAVKASESTSVAKADRQIPEAKQGAELSLPAREIGQSGELIIKSLGQLTGSTVRVVTGTTEPLLAGLGQEASPKAEATPYTSGEGTGLATEAASVATSAVSALSTPESSSERVGAALAGLVGASSLAGVVAPVLEPVSGVLAPVAGALEPVVDPVLEPVAGVVGAVASVAIPLLEPVTGGVIVPVVEAVVAPVLEPVAGLAAPVVEAVTSVVAPVLEPVTDLVDPVVNTVTMTVLGPLLAGTSLGETVTIVTSVILGESRNSVIDVGIDIDHNAAVDSIGRDIVNLQSDEIDVDVTNVDQLGFPAHYATSTIGKVQSIGSDAIVQIGSDSGDTDQTTWVLGHAGSPAVGVGSSAPAGSASGGGGSAGAVSLPATPPINGLKDLSERSALHNMILPSGPTFGPGTCPD